MIFILFFLTPISQTFLHFTIL